MTSMRIFMERNLLQTARLSAGLVMMAFVLLHLLNHSLGLVSVAAMNSMQDWRMEITHSMAGQIGLLAAALIHMTLALLKLAARGTLRLPRWELFQIATGIAIPLLLIPHVVATNHMSRAYGVFISYDTVLYALWPNIALRQSALVLLVWTHACVGVHFWLRFRPGYRRLVPYLYALAIVVPLLALLGFATGGREMAARAADPAVLARMRSDLSWPSAEAIASGKRIAGMIEWGFLAALAAALLAILARQALARRAPSFTVTYTNGPTVKAPVGLSLLEVSRANKVPHTSVCGGRARCSTCRVRVEAGAEALPPPRQGERATLARIKAPPEVRLACQLRPQTPVTVTRQVAPTLAAEQRTLHGRDEEHGVERTVAVMFLDVRGFTELSENRLPYDLVYMLNQLFASIGSKIVEEGGWIDKYIGDGLLAVFGREAGSRTGCRQALRAAAAIDAVLVAVNRRLEAEIGRPLRIGMGIHVGPVVIGRIGHTAGCAITVIGGTVNAASRLEGLSKERGVQLAMSKRVAEVAGWPAGGVPGERVELRGVAEAMDVLLVPEARGVKDVP